MLSSDMWRQPRNLRHCILQPMTYHSMSAVICHQVVDSGRKSQQHLIQPGLFESCFLIPDTVPSRNELVWVKLHSQTQTDLIPSTYHIMGLIINYKPLRTQKACRDGYKYIMWFLVVKYLLMLLNIIFILGTLGKKSSNTTNKTFSGQKVDIPSSFPWMKDLR